MSLAKAKKQSPVNTRYKKRETAHSALKKSYSILSSPQIPIIQLKPTCPCGGGCPRCTAINQSKLKIGQANDKYEQEADRVAEQVMRMPEDTVVRSQLSSVRGEDGYIQRQEEPEQKDGRGVQIKLRANNLPQRQQETDFDEEEDFLQAKATSGHTPQVTPNVAANIQNLRGGGLPLPPNQRHFFESYMGQDFSGVRIHTDSKAADTAQTIQAKAFTLGNNIVFNSGQYSHDNQEGKKLLAHELTHVVQQNGEAGVGLKRAPTHFTQAHELTHVVQQGYSGPRSEYVAGSETRGSSDRASVVQRSGQGPHLVQRACLLDSECKPSSAESLPRAPTSGSNRTVDEPAAKEMVAAHQASPRAKAYPAEEVQKLFESHLPDLAKLVHGVFVDETISTQFGGGHVPCGPWARVAFPQGTDMPKFASDRSGCVLVKASLEEQAKVYNQGGKPPVYKDGKPVNHQDGKPANYRRALWLDFFLLRVLTHETTHQRVNDENIDYPSYKDCTQKTLDSDFGELAGIINEFPSVNRLEGDDRAKMLDFWFNTKVKVKTGVSAKTISGSIREIRCRCECTDAETLIKQAFRIAATNWTEDDKRAFHAEMKRGKGKELDVYWPYDPPARIGRVGRHELSLTAGLGFSGSDKLKVGMLTYRYLLTNWAEGRLRLTGGAQVNAASIFGAGELGAATVGLQFISTPVSREKSFGGFTGRLETGFGLGEFSLKPASPQGPEATGRCADWILQVGGGIQFFIPSLTDLTPVSIEVAHRLTQPLDPDAKLIHTFGVSTTLSF